MFAVAWKAALESERVVVDTGENVDALSVFRLSSLWIAAVRISRCSREMLEFSCRYRNLNNSKTFPMEICVLQHKSYQEFTARMNHSCRLYPSLFHSSLRLLRHEIYARRQSSAFHLVSYSISFHRDDEGRKEPKNDFNSAFKSTAKFFFVPQFFLPQNSFRMCNEKLCSA